MRRDVRRREFLRWAGRSGLGTLLATCGFGFSPRAQAETARRPNIIFLMADDMGYGDVGCYGSTQIPTPLMDRLAAEGIRFIDAHTPSGVCTPTRYGVLTGRYSWRSKMKKGVLRGYSPALLEPGRLTVASMLKRHGYVTACIGKWHLGFGTADKVDYTRRLRPGPLEMGFDYFFGIPASLDMPPYCFIENDRLIGELSVEKDPYNTLQRQGPMTPGWRDEEVGPTFARKAISFIERSVLSEPDRPFFLYFPTPAPHTPCTPPDFIEGQSQAGVRGDMVTEVDWTLGQLMATLQRLKIDDNTLIIVTSDNGALTVGPAGWAKDPPEKYDIVHHGHAPNGPLRGQKSDLYEGGHRVPFIAWWPGKIRPGTTSDEPICLIDLLATCADIVGCKLPADAAEDSESILPILLGRESDEPLHEAIVHHSGQGMFALRQGKWKLILGRGSGGFSAPARVKPKPGEPEGQLYDLETDLAETTNLWSERPDVVRRLTRLLERFQQQGHSRRSLSRQ
jgi:arylsulfatase A-like enzyme